MYITVNFLLLLWAFYYEGAYSQMTFPEKLKDLSWYPIFKCKHIKHNDQSPTVSLFKPCSCSRMCSQFDTCCLDALGSRSKKAKIKTTCRKVKTFASYPSSYHMIDRCDKIDSVWENLCNDEQSPEDDLLRRVPVTSLFTTLTYKNYFCLRCHETTDDFVYWNVLLKSNESENLGPDMKHDQLVYVKEYQSWMVRIEKNGAWLPVDYSILVPPGVRNLQVECNADLISRCDDSWPDDSVRQNCNSYMSLTQIYSNSQILWYRNPHCALCNFENLSQMSCGHRYAAGVGGGSAFAVDYGKDGKMLFSFTHLMDIDPRDGDKVGRIKMCEEDSLWDPIAKTCRELSCALPGYIIKDQKCVPP